VLGMQLPSGICGRERFELRIAEIQVFFALAPLRNNGGCIMAGSFSLYHLGIRSKVARTTLADANESRDWRIFVNFAQVLIRIARPRAVGGTHSPRFLERRRMPRPG
jgi:hypothetical protein